MELLLEHGYCVLHLDMMRHPTDPARVESPEAAAWLEAEAFARERALTWWDFNPVFPDRQEAERYAWLAPVNTEIVAVEFSEEEQDEAEGWFDSFRSPHWFRVIRE